MRSELVGNSLLAVGPGATVHDAVLEDTMFSTICSDRAYAGVIAEEVVR